MNDAETIEGLKQAFANNTNALRRFAQSIEALIPIIEAWKQAMDALRDICSFRRDGWLLIGDRMVNELLSWSVPEPLAYWATYRVPYRYRVGFVKMIRR